MTLFRGDNGHLTFIITPTAAFAVQLRLVYLKGELPDYFHLSDTKLMVITFVTECVII